MEYVIKAIKNNVVYIKESEGHLLGFYNLVSWKNYPKTKNIWKPLSIVQYLKKMISSFYKDQPSKPIETFSMINQYY